MQEESRVKETEQNVREKDAAWQRRRRIKRIKIAIVAIVILFLIIPTICCILLGLKVMDLQRQVDGLVSIHEQEVIRTAGDTDADNVAYAAELRVLLEQQSDYPEALSGEEGQKETEDQKAGPVSETGSSAEQLADATVPSTGTKQKTDIPDDAHPTPTGFPTDQDSQVQAEGKPLEDGNIIPAPGEFQLSSDTYPKEAIEEAVAPTGPVAPVTAGQTDNSSPGGADDKTKVVSDDSAGKKPGEGEVQIASTGKYAGKKVYLTFDDGPSPYTEEILDILDEYGVKATFFVIGKTDKESKRLYREIIERGHTLGMHSYSHVYKQIYNSAEDFDKDFTKLWKLLYDTTGYMPTIYRFPGGSGNRVNKYGMEEFIRYLKDKKIIYFDWNVDNGDATGVEFTKEQLSKNILNGVAAKKRAMVLMHDANGKRTTVDSLPIVLEALLSGGAEVLPLSEEVTPIQQIKAEDVK